MTLLKLIGMLLRVYYPRMHCRSCGYHGIADMRYRMLLPWLALMLIGSAMYLAFAAVYCWAGFYFIPNWVVGIPAACLALYFIFIYTPDLFCPKCSRS